MKVSRRRVGRFRITLQDNTDLTALPHRLLGRCDRTWPADRERHHSAREKHKAAYRYDQESIGRSGWRGTAQL